MTFDFQRSFSHTNTEILQNAILNRFLQMQGPTPFCRAQPHFHSVLEIGTGINGDLLRILRRNIQESKSCRRPCINNDNKWFDWNTLISNTIDLQRSCPGRFYKCKRYARKHAWWRPRVVQKDSDRLLARIQRSPRKPTESCDPRDRIGAIWVP